MRVVMFITVMEAVIVSITLFSTRYILGYAYSNEKEVVDYVKEMVPLICLQCSWITYKESYQVIFISSC